MKRRVTFAAIITIGIVLGNLCPVRADEEQVGPFRWARKLYDPTVAPEAQKTAISRNSDIEHASLVVGSAMRQGVVTLDQWSGSTLQDGVRNWSANTLVGTSGRNYWVSLDDWDIEEGTPDATGQYVFFPKWQQDAHLRFGYLAVNGGDLVVMHGQNFSLDSVYAYDAVVVELAFRIIAGGSPGWQLGDYNGTPPQCGVWQVRAGQTLLQAQANDANRLAGPAFLNGTTPDTDMAFQFVLQGDGTWTLNIDVNKDGTIDRLVTSADAGNAPATVPVTMASGLVISSVAAGGSPIPKVGRSPMMVSYLDNSPTYLAINAGGPNYTTLAGITYAADNDFVGGSAVTSTFAVAGTDDDALYQSYRQGANFSYAVPVEDGDYVITLHFVEPSHTRSGLRLFDVTAEGRVVLDDLDVYMKAGGRRTAWQVDVPVTVTDGELNLGFIKSKGQAIVSAILIVPVEKVGPFAWARKLYDPDVKAEAQPGAIAASLDLETATARAGSGKIAGQIALDQWNGRNLAGGYTWSANTLLGAASAPYYLSLDEWEILDGTRDAATGEYVFFPKAQQDARWTFGYLATARQGIAMRHGRGIQLGAQRLSCNAVMVALPFRNVAGFGSTTWQTGDYNGNPAQAGVWQVPAGTTLEEAQRSAVKTVNRLSGSALIEFLKTHGPDTSMAFLFTIGAGGSWQLDVDLNNDGKADRVFKSSDVDSHAATVTDVSKASGLMTSMVFTGGVKGVGRVPATIGYEALAPAPSFGSVYLGEGLFQLHVVNNGGPGYLGYDIYGLPAFYDLGYFEAGESVWFEVAPPGYPARTQWTLRKWARQTESDPWVQRGGTHVFTARD